MDGFDKPTATTSYVCHSVYLLTEWDGTLTKIQYSRFKNGFI